MSSFYSKKRTGFQCENCGKEFNYTSRLESTRYEISPLSPFAEWISIKELTGFQCKTCGKRFPFAHCFAPKDLAADWLYIFNRQSVSLQKMLFNGKTARKMKDTTKKSIENCAEKQCQIVCAILFDLF